MSLVDNSCQLIRIPNQAGETSSKKRTNKRFPLLKSSRKCWMHFLELGCPS